MTDMIQLEPVYMKDAESNLIILDQTLLPQQTVMIELTSTEAIWEAIYKLQVRGAPAIGVAAAYGIYQAVRHLDLQDSQAFALSFAKAKDYLASSRPTAVNLFWALDRMSACLTDHLNLPVAQIKEKLFLEARAIQAEDAWVCDQIANYGADFIEDGMGILTHCNAGKLATAGIGTALGPIYRCHDKGFRLKVFADETRPLLQGARLTAYELSQAGIDTTLICDNMASVVMKNGWVQAVFVGCDRVAANGDTANKIGTAGVSILAKYYGIPFYVCAPTSTIDLECPTGKDIHIEERKAEEVTETWYSQRMAPDKINVFNPAFDVSSEENITAIITEYGVAKPPFNESLKTIFERKAQAKQ